MGGKRPTEAALRPCDLCGQVDDGPRHVLMGTREEYRPAQAAVRAMYRNLAEMGVSGETETRVAEAMLDTAASDRHPECCAEAGCPTGDCG